MYVLIFVCMDAGSPRLLWLELAIETLCVLEDILV